MEHIKVEKFSFQYPGQSKKALLEVDLSVQYGSFTVLCGPSGCGKSTLLRQLKKVLSPYGESEGKIFFAGQEIESLNHRTQSSEIGFVMQDPDNQIVTDKVWHELAFGLESMGYDSATIRMRVAEMASYFGIQDWFYKEVRELSGGQKQILNLASIMAMHPSLLILDEPTSQLDPIAASEFLETIKKINQELGMTILITEHRLEDVIPMADQVILMEDGKVLCDGAPQEVGMWMYQNNHSMFKAMPTAMQIYAETEKECVKKGETCPLNVRDGRIWLNMKINCNENICDKKTGQKCENDRSSSERTKASAMIHLKDVWFRYEKTSPDVLKGLSMEVKKGEFYCLLGGNGTGKSTLLSIISRLNRPYRGQIQLAGKDIRGYSNQELYQSFLGVVPQNPQSLFVAKTVQEELYEMIGRELPINMEKKEVVRQIAGITHLEQMLEQHPYDLSGGEQQRLALAKILLLRPKILLLDEPTKGLDSALKEEFAEILGILKESGVTILMISHDIEFCAKYADRCGMFFDGEIVTENVPQMFFAGNSFYTTAANRMVRHIEPSAVTVPDVIQMITKKQRK